MRTILGILIGLALVGCSAPRWASDKPCDDGNGAGYKTTWSAGATILDNTDSPCYPCSEAKSAEARFVCFGEKGEASLKPWPATITVTRPITPPMPTLSGRERARLNEAIRDRKKVEELGR